jgi:hypothetical protein
MAQGSRLTPVGLTALFVLAGCSAALAAERSVADALLHDIERLGASTVLSELVKNDQKFDDVLDHIESGRSEWLEVARRLKPASDAGSSLALNYSVARALLKQPERVLDLVGRGFEIDRICTSPFIEPEKGVAERYERQALKILARLQQSGVTHAAECAVLIRSR